MTCKVSCLLNSDTFQRLIDTGADTAEVDGLGWNCLFHCVAHASFPQSAKEFKALRSLLAVFDDIYATDIWGFDIFSYVNEENRWIDSQYQDFGSYRQDLWYCALKRSGLDVRFDIAPCVRIARYTPYYTPKHYLALCLLDSWNRDDLDGQVDHLLPKCPTTEEEAHSTKRLEQEQEAESRWRAGTSSIYSMGVSDS